jgi:hypothetical protein
LVASGGAIVAIWTSLAIQSYPATTVGYFRGPDRNGWRWHAPFAAGVILLASAITISLWLTPLVLAIFLVTFDGPIWLHNRRLSRMRSGV